MRTPSALVATGLPLASAAWVGVAALFGPWALAAALAGPALVLAALWSPGWSLVALFAAFPYATEGLGFRALNYAWPALIVGAWTLHLLRRRQGPAPLPGGLGVWFALFLLWAAVSSLAAEMVLGSLGTVARYAWTLILLTALVSLWQPRHTRVAFLSFAVLCVPIAVYGVMQFVQAGPAQFFLQKSINPERLSSIYANPNTLGLMMAHALLIFTAYGLLRARERRTFRLNLLLAALAAAGALFVVSIAVSLSRSAYIYMFAGVAVLTLTLAPRKLRYAGIAVLPPMTVLALVSLPDWAGTLLRLGAGFSSRNKLWESGWRMMQDNPWAGVGPGSGVFETYRHLYMHTGSQLDLTWTRAGAAHNVFLTKGAEMGWPGLLLAVALFVLIWKAIPAALREYREGNWVAGAAAAMLVGLTLRGLVETGGTLSVGHPTDSLLFLSFAALILMPRHHPAAVACPADEFRAGRTGGQRVWRGIIEYFHIRGLPVVTEDQAPVPAALRDRPLPLLFWYNAVYGTLRRGVLFVDQSQSGRLALLTRRLRRRPGVRLVVLVQHLRDSFRLSHPLYVRLLEWNENQLLRSAHRVIVHTRIEASLVERRGVNPDRIRVVPLGREEDHAPIPVRELEPHERLRLLWVGGDFDRKGLPQFLRALAQTDAPRPRLTVAGDPHDPEIMLRAQALTRELGLEAEVRFVGRVEEGEYRALWDRHDVFVLPSLHEGHGLAVDEALARGMPALLSPLPVFLERLDTSDAWLVDPQDPEAVARALNELRDTDTRRRLAENGLRRAAAFPRWADTLRGYEAVIQEALDAEHEAER